MYFLQSPGVSLLAIMWPQAHVLTLNWSGHAAAACAMCVSAHVRVCVCVCLSACMRACVSMCARVCVCNNEFQESLCISSALRGLPGVRT